MASLDDIRQGLAANLAVLKDSTPAAIGQVSAYLLESPTPPSIMVAGIDSGGIEYLTFDGESIRATILIEACLGLISDIGSQKALNRLLAASGASSVVAAVEADQSLTSRLRDNGTVLTGQTAAANSVAFSEYRGQSRFVLPNRSEVLLATWAFEVIT